MRELIRVGDIKKESTGEVRGHFADIIYFQGCSKKCGYCFNKSLIPTEGGLNMSAEAIWHIIKDTMSDVLVLTGGEPLEQTISELFKLTVRAKYNNRKVILETCKYHESISNAVDKVLFTIKTFDVDIEAIKKYKERENVDFCIVIGHDYFDLDGYKFVYNIIGRTPIYNRFNRDIPQNFRETYRFVKSRNKNFLVFGIIYTFFL